MELFVPVVSTDDLAAGVSRTVKLVLSPDAAYTIAGTGRAKFAVISD